MDPEEIMARTLLKKQPGLGWLSHDKTRMLIGLKNGNLLTLTGPFYKYNQKEINEVIELKLEPYYRRGELV